MNDRVQLIAIDQDGGIVEEQLLSYEDFYESLTDLIDSNDYRASRKIRRVKGQIFDGKGRLDQEFENHYSIRGEYLHGKAIYSDGTVVEG